MKEDFLHFLWQNRYLQSDLKTTEGETIVVKKTGILNHDSGPDFLAAQLKIDNQEWVGNVEIHLKSSDWYAHNHQNDEAYQNVILHVVWQHDKEVILKNGVCLPTLELSKYANPAIISRFQNFTKTEGLPCQNQAHVIDEFLVNNFLDRLIIERLEDRTARIQKDYLTNKYDLPQIFYRLMALGFGQKVNQLGFDVLSRELPLRILMKHVGKLKEVEALIFGVAGFLESPEDKYQQDLQRIYAHLKNKYKLKELEAPLWKFSKMRPQNFPTVRLAQFASLVNRSPDFLNLLSLTPNYKELYKLIEGSTSVYWKNHYRFGKESVERDKNLSKNFINHLIINVFVPFYFYFKRRSGSASLEMVYEILSKLPAEDNRSLRTVLQSGLKNESAFQSQALYHLYNHYCVRKKCLNCRIGQHLLSNKQTDKLKA